MTRFPCAIAPVCSINMLGEQAFEVIGPTPTGFRINSFISGGEVSGPRIRGIVRTRGCADWAVIRPDDVADIDVKMTIETHDGALLFVTYTGAGWLGDGGSDRVQRAKPAAAVIPLRISARMMTASPVYAWVNRVQFVGVGATTIGAPTRIDYDIYALE